MRLSLRDVRRASASCCSTGRPLDADVRNYTRIGDHRSAGAARCAASRAGARRPTSSTSAATPELRGYEYLQFLGIADTRSRNAELRFPLIEAMLTPLGVLGGIRGVFFAGMGGAYFDGQDFTWLRARHDGRAAHRRLRGQTS